MSNLDLILNNPLEIQRAILEDYVARLDGDVAIVDANNTFAFLLETFARTTAEATVAIDNKLNSLYPRRATSTKELYQHLSDYDYVGFFSAPASLRMKLTLHRDFIVDNSVAVAGTNYKLIIVPKDTIFMVGRYPMGLYYPIHIRINQVVNTISAVYETSEANPLYSLNVNTIQVKEITTSGIDLVELEFDVFQFTKQVLLENVRAEIGFNKAFKFTDKFYAIRVIDTTNNREMAYTLSDSVYDPSNPTVKLKVYPETNLVEVSIPQIYFSSGKVGTQIKLEIYSTLGALDVSIANIKLEDIKANFALTSPDTDTIYSEVLKNIPTIIIAPTNNRIVGGSNGMTFDQIKEYTVYRNKATVVPISRMDMERFFNNKGFKYLAKIDNLTDRRYHAYKRISLSNVDLNVINGTLTITAEDPEVNGSIIYQNNESIVILPTAIYKHTYLNNRFSILDNDSRLSLVTAPPTLLAESLNAEVKYCQPHHLVIGTQDRYPRCVAYDLLTATTESITFIEENINLSAQLSVVSVAIRHLLEGAGGYTIRVGMRRSADILTVPNTDLNVFLSVISTEGYMLGIEGTYVGTFDELDAYDFPITTNYKLNGEKITITNFLRSTGYAGEYEIDLAGTMHIATFIKRSYFPTVANNYDITNKLISTASDWLGISLQTFDYRLGTNLSDILDTNILTTWTSQTYQTYPADVPLLYEHDVYATNAQGILEYTIVDGEVLTNKLHSAGDVVMDSVTGEPIIQHYAGDMYHDVSGNPIAIGSRMKDFTIDFSGFDFKHRVTADDFLIKLSKELHSYYDTIREMDQSVLENTQIFFKPISTSGLGKYKINNLVTINSSLELSFEFNCYVAQAILNNTSTLDTIGSKVVNIIGTHLLDPIFSAIEITADIQYQLVDYIKSIDLVSMNGESAIQTLISVETEKMPQIATVLSVNQDNRLILIPKVVINYKPLDL